MKLTLVLGTTLRVSSAVLAIASLPVIAKELGSDEFGVFALGVSIIALANLFDFGSLARLTIRLSFGWGRTAVALKHIAKEVAVQGAITVIVLGVIWAPIGDRAIELLVGRSVGLAETRQFLTALFVGAGSLRAAQLIGVPADIRGEYHRSQLIGPCAQFVTWLVLIGLAMSVQLTLPMAGLAFAVVGAAALVTAQYLAFRSLRDGHEGHGRELGKSRVGLATQVANASDYINYSADRILLAALLGPRSVGVFEFAGRGAQLPRMAVAAIAPILLPRLSSVAPERRAPLSGRIAREYDSLLVLAIAAAVPVAAFAVPVWAATGGLDGEAARDAGILLIAGYGAHLSTAPASDAVKIGPRPMLSAWFALATAAANIVLTVVFVVKWGVVGAALATYVALTVGSLLFRTSFAVRQAVEGARIDPLLACVVVLAGVIPVAKFAGLGAVIVSMLLVLAPIQAWRLRHRAVEVYELVFQRG